MSHTAPLFATGPEDWRPTTDDHYTPAWIFESMGLEFDLDVAAPPGGVPWIPAKRYFTISDDGLSQPWEGLVWCNPPFSAAKKWASKWIEHANGVLLVSGSPAWMGWGMGMCEAVFVCRQEIRFSGPTGENKTISYPIWMGALGGGVVGLERLAPHGTLLTPREAA